MLEISKEILILSNYWSNTVVKYKKMCQKVELKEYLILLTFAVVSAAVH